jgi:hypothetical protein
MLQQAPRSLGGLAKHAPGKWGLPRRCHLAVLPLHCACFPCLRPRTCFSEQVKGARLRSHSTRYEVIVIQYTHSLSLDSPAAPRPSHSLFSRLFLSRPHRPPCTAASPPLASHQKGTALLRGTQLPRPRSCPARHGHRNASQSAVPRAGPCAPARVPPSRAAGTWTPPSRQ